MYFEWLVDVEFVNSVMKRYSLVQNCNFDVENNMAVGYLLLIGLCMWLNKTRNDTSANGCDLCAFACAVKGCVFEAFVCWETSSSGG